jgi:hypothetical protein
MAWEGRDPTRDQQGPRRKEARFSEAKQSELRSELGRRSAPEEDPGTRLWLIP